MSRYVTVEPDWLLDGVSVQSRGKITFDESGTIVDPETVPQDAPTTHLRFRDKAILPGFVNTHSHAFQRLIRGRTHDRVSTTDDFWTWRHTMMTAASRLTPEDLYAVSYLTFVEMLQAGFTTVGEFHYLHRQPDGRPYDEPNYLSKIVIEAASDAGIRIVLLRVAYCRSGFADTPPEGGQRRFVEPDPEQILSDLDSLQNNYRQQPGNTPKGVTIGVAPHSIRAVDGPTLRRLFTWAETYNTPFHIHAAEQPAEVQQSLQFLGQRPIEYLADLGVLSQRTTLVHATHVTANEIHRIHDSKATVCVCPTTEADLGDGLLPAGPMVHFGVPLAIGSDSQAIIDPFTELRLLETGERLRTGKRNCLIAASGTGESITGNVAPLLLQSGTHNGRRSLEPNQPYAPRQFVPGQPADFVVVDLLHPSLVGCSGATLLPTLMLHAGTNVISDVWVMGRRRVADHHHPGWRRAAQTFKTLCQRVFEQS